MPRRLMPRRLAPSPPRVAGAASATVLASAVLLIVVAVWTPDFGWSGYLSALGGPDASLRGPYAAAIVGAAFGVGLLAVALRALRAPAVLLAVTALCLAVSAAVPCTPGCPLPVADGFPWNGVVGWNDTVHAVVSAGAFAAAAVAMALVASRSADRVLRRLSAAGAPVAGALIVIQAGWTVFVRSHGPVTGTTERIAVAVALLWVILVGVRLWWAPDACRTVGSGRTSCASNTGSVSPPASTTPGPCSSTSGRSSPSSPA
jgi:hypothetical membrane protein